MITLPFANVVQPLIDVFEAVLKFFHNHVGLSWGLAIVALTMLMRAVLLPVIGLAPWTGWITFEEIEQV